MENKITIEKLNSNNYFSWKFKVKLLLIKEELWEVITDELPTSARQLQRWNKKDAKALCTIALNVEDKQLVHVRNKETAKQAWNALKSVFEQNTLTNRVSLYKKIALHRWTIGSTMENHINQLDSYFQHLSELGDEPDELWKIGLLFASLPKEYATLITALEGRNEKDLTWNMVYSKLMDEHQRQIQNADEYKDEGVMKISIEKGSSYCYFCKKNNHKMEDCFQLKRYKQFKEFEEYHNKLEQSKRAEKDEKIGNILAETEEDNTEFMLCITEVEEKSSPNIFSSKLKRSIEILKIIRDFKILIEDSIETKFKKINQIYQYFHQLKIYEVDFHDNFKKAALISSLPKDYHQIFFKLENTLDWKQCKKTVKKFINTSKKTVNNG